MPCGLSGHELVQRLVGMSSTEALAPAISLPTRGQEDWIWDLYKPIRLDRLSESLRIPTLLAPKGAAGKHSCRIKLVEAQPRASSAMVGGASSGEPGLRAALVRNEASRHLGIDRELCSTLSQDPWVNRQLFGALYSKNIAASFNFIQLHSLRPLCH